ncbi:MAG: hypothetical protein LBI29_02760 [Rickettsiales bacterium]|jgi:hypothetical protein|nr:hypothetical protein [Rickettsiales bacterium]
MISINSRNGHASYMVFNKYGNELMRQRLSEKPKCDSNGKLLVEYLEMLRGNIDDESSEIPDDEIVPSRCDNLNCPVIKNTGK